jgi:hypothetical protein
MIWTQWIVEIKIAETSLPATSCHSPVRTLIQACRDVLGAAATKLIVAHLGSDLGFNHTASVAVNIAATETIWHVRVRFVAMTQSPESPHTYVMARSFGSLVFLHFSFILTISAGRDAITIVADAEDFFVVGVVVLAVLKARINRDFIE